MIKSSGYRISPTEIEELVYALPAVKECAVVGIPDDLLGQAVVVVYTSDDEEAEVNKAILSACREALPAYMVPSHVARAHRAIGEEAAAERAETAGDPPQDRQHLEMRLVLLRGDDRLRGGGRRVHGSI